MQFIVASSDAFQLTVTATSMNFLPGFHTLDRTLIAQSKRLTLMLGFSSAVIFNSKTNQKGAQGKGRKKNSEQKQTKHNKHEKVFLSLLSKLHVMIEFPSSPFIRSRYRLFVLRWCNIPFSLRRNLYEILQRC